MSTAAERLIIIHEKRSGRSGQGALYGNSYLFLKYQITELVIVTNLIMKVIIMAFSQSLRGGHFYL